MAVKIFEVNITSDTLVGFAIASAHDVEAVNKILRKENSPFKDDVDNPDVEVEIKEVNELTPLIHRNCLISYHKHSI